MTYFDSLDKKKWQELGETFQLFDPYPLDEWDVKRSELIAREVINNYSTRLLEVKDTVKFDDLLHRTSMRYYNLGFQRTARDVVSILSKTQFFSNQSINDHDFTVQSMLVQTGAMISKECYYLEVPKIFSESSVHFMAHELAHILKEKNPLECKGIYSDNEVIPILLELISAHQARDNNVFKKREYLMLDTATLFLNLKEDMAKIGEQDFVGFNACYRQCVLYLNSFYYSLKLFGLYLRDDDFVLGIISDVLNHILTTRDVIELYLKGNDGLYNEGLIEFRSKLV